MLEMQSAAWAGDGDLAAVLGNPSIVTTELLAWKPVSCPEDSRDMGCQLSAEIFEILALLENCSLVPALVPACRHNPCCGKLSSAIMGHASQLS